METQTIRKLKFKDSSEYKGTTVDGVPHGKGKMKYRKGTFYEGDFVYGELHGNGKFTDKYGVYEGEWVNGKQSGKGKFISVIYGAVYEGDLVLERWGVFRGIIFF